MRRRVLRLLPLALVVATVGSLLGPATTAPAAPIDDKQAEAAQLEQQITDNGRRIDALNEQINSAQIALDNANDAIAVADALVAAATAKTKDLRQELARRAADVYIQSSSSGGVAELDAKSATDLNARRKYTALAAQREKHLVNQLARAKEDLAARKADADEARATAETKKQEIESTKAELVAGDNTQRALLAQVKGDIAELVAKAEAERKAREEAAARARIAAAAAAATSRAGADTTARKIPAPSQGAAGAIAYAQAQLGKPYCYGGAGPDCFDCSGLTMRAWGAAGVAMPHGSTEQYNMFPHVPLSQAQPGDLIAWDGHIGLYIGGGMMIHAPHSGTVVQIAPFYGTPWGAARPG
ncbi:MAG: NlpC/P60 family protein [Acidimicrobiia bacterium]